MLIIFDLDDTLIQTTNSVTFPRIANAVNKMAEAGLTLPDLASAIAELQEINSSSNSAEEALRVFLSRYNADSRFFQIGWNEIYHTFDDDSPVLPSEGAQTVLSELAKNFQLALVTRGEEITQMCKLKNSGIDSALFSKIIICASVSEKLSAYQQIIREAQVDPREVIVCGDRISVDLSPGKSLGCVTVHMLQGRGLLKRGAQEDVDFEITKLDELYPILSATFSRSFL